MSDAECCTLQNPLFSTLGQVTFRLAQSDGAPVVVVPLGDREAALPLRSLQREFHIADDSPDGRMLALIIEALDYVPVLHPGDPLPAEVLSGAASWQPEPRHLRTALAKLRFHLLSWIDPEATANRTADSAGLEALEADPVLRARMQKAFEQAAVELDLPDSEAAVQTLGSIAQEMSYIEALREDLLLPAKDMHRRLCALRDGRQLGADRQGVLTRLRRLSETAQQKLSSRFDDVDVQTGELTTGLRNAASQCAFIRSNRDWLYRSRRAWEPILAQWRTAPQDMDEKVWLLVGRTYQFLAPRFMPVQEWKSARVGQQTRGGRKQPVIMTW